MRAIGDLQLNGENCWLGLFINSIHNKTYHYLLSSCTKSLQLINPLGLQGAMSLAVTPLGYPNVHIVQEQYLLSAAPGTSPSARRYVHPHPSSPAPPRPLTLNVGTSDSVSLTLSHLPSISSSTIRDYIETGEAGFLQGHSVRTFSVRGL